jgi:hypothetical protein
MTSIILTGITLNRSVSAFVTIILSNSFVIVKDSINE